MTTPTQQSHEGSALCLNDLVSLPIIITDFDAEPRGENKKIDDRTPSGPTPTGSGCAASDAPLQKWATGFNNFADDMWRQMTASMRSKLREAAVEVLKRTDETKAGAGGEWWGQWDDDARFFD